jgi:F0F1-type ATP synthase membrane subunit b/b'
VRSALLIALCLALVTPVWASGGEGQSHLGIPDAVWLPVNLAAFLGLLYWLVGRPLGRLLGSRRESIGLELEAARRKLAEADELRAQVVRRLEQVELELAELRTRAESDGRTEAERIAQQTDAEAERFLRRVEEEIARREVETRNVLAREAAALTVELAHGILTREVDAGDRDRVFERTLGALETWPGRG